MEWQFRGDDEWVFGEKVRGIVRYPRAEVYFDEERGWVWFVLGETENRGISGKLEWAIDECEKVMGITG